MRKHIRFDWAVKKLLRSKSNFCVLEGFLSELLGQEIKIKTLLESESNKEQEDSKQNRVDLLAEDQENKLLLIEVQCGSEVDYFHRIAFNTSRLISEYLNKSDDYGKIRKVITVNIIYFDFGQGNDYIYYGNTTFKGRHDEKDILKPSLRQMKEFNIKNVHDIFPEHYILKVNNFNDVAHNSLDEWIYFLKNSEIKDEFSAKGMSQAREKLDEINLTKEEWPNYKAYLKRCHDEASFAFNARIELEQERELGKKEGIALGIDEGMALVIQSMSKTLDVNSIAKILNLTHAQVSHYLDFQIKST